MERVQNKKEQLGEICVQTSHTEHFSMLTNSGNLVHSADWKQLDRPCLFPKRKWCHQGSAAGRVPGSCPGQDPTGMNGRCHWHGKLEPPDCWGFTQAGLSQTEVVGPCRKTANELIALSFQLFLPFLKLTLTMTEPAKRRNVKLSFGTAKNRATGWIQSMPL